MLNSIKRQIGAVFVPVSDIETATSWYTDLLGLARRPEVQFGHLAVLPMSAGPAIVLDSKGFVGPHDRKPLFHLTTDDLPAALAYMTSKGVSLATEITDGVFFNFKDPDGNLIMVADVTPAPNE